MNNSKSGRLFIVLGGLFILCGLFLFTINSFDSPFGTIFLNLILFTLDCLWLIGSGRYLLISGLQAQKMKHNIIMDSQICSYFSIFNLNFIFFSIIFNRLVEPLAESNGRIITYCLQSAGRIIRPSLSVDFMIPFISIVFFIACFVQHRRKRVNDKLNS